MSRALLIGACIASLLVGCVSVSAPTVPPLVLPSFGITTPAPIATATATASATVAAPTVAPPTEVATPTAPPATPTTAPTSTPTEPAETPPASGNDLILSDDMSDPTSGWGLNDTELSTIAYQDGALRIQIHNDSGAAFSGRLVADEYAVLIAAAEFVPSNEGGFGLLCASDEGVHFGAALTTDGALLFFSIEAGVVSVLERINDIGSDFPANESTAFGLECSGTATGALRLVAVVPGKGALGVHQIDEGPATFNGVVVYGEAFVPGFAVDIGEVAAFGIAGSATGMTPEAEALLTHVPDLFRSQCTESPVTSSAEAILHCYLQVEGTGAELAEYQALATNADMDEAYQGRVDDYGVPSEGSCQSGPNETTWSIDDVALGRLQCAPQQVGIRIDWTDERLAILSALIDFDGDYENTYQTWIEAGPEV